MRGRRRGEPDRRRRPASPQSLPLRAPSGRGASHPEAGPAEGSTSRPRPRPHPPQPRRRRCQNGSRSLSPAQAWRRLSAAAAHWLRRAREVRRCRSPIGCSVRVYTNPLDADWLRGSEVLTRLEERGRSNHQRPPPSWKGGVAIVATPKELWMQFPNQTQRGLWSTSELQHC